MHCNLFVNSAERSIPFYTLDFRVNIHFTRSVSLSGLHSLSKAAHAWRSRVAMCVVNAMR